MAKMKYWNGSAWVILDAKDADTLDGKHASAFAASSHGEHVPTKQTADARKFLRNDNTWQTLPSASTSATGIVQLNDATNSTSTTQAATANAVKKTVDMVNTKANIKGTLTETSVADNTKTTSIIETGLYRGVFDLSTLPSILTAQKHDGQGILEVIKYAPGWVGYIFRSAHSLDREFHRAMANSSFSDWTENVVKKGDVITFGSVDQTYSASVAGQVGPGYLGSHGSVYLSANTDNAVSSGDMNNEFVHLTAGRGIKPTGNYGLKVAHSLVHCHEEALFDKTVSIQYPQSLKVRHIEGADNKEIYLNYNCKQPVYVGTDKGNYDIGKAVSNLQNQNLLINGGFDVWQRGAKIVTTKGLEYTADRWLNWSTATGNEYTKTGNCLSWKPVANCNIMQILESNMQLAGKHITASMQITIPNGVTLGYELCVVKNGVGDINNFPFAQRTLTSTNGGWSTAILTGQVPHLAPGQKVCLRIYTNSIIPPGSEILISQAKLEVGQIATEFSPRPYAEELQLCQRFYEILMYPNYDYGLPVSEVISNADGTFDLLVNFTFSAKKAYENNGALSSIVKGVDKPRLVDRGPNGGIISAHKYADAVIPIYINQNDVQVLFRFNSNPLESNSRWQTMDTYNAKDLYVAIEAEYY